METGANAALSTEITGYALSALLELFQRTGGQRYLDAALRAARYLAEEAWDESLATFPFETGPGVPPRAYFFDLGIIARALLRLARLTGEERWQELARRTAVSMERDFRAAPDGSHPILLLPGKQPVPHEPWWSREPGCFHLKAALAWYELGMSEPWERQLEFSLRVWRRVVEDPVRERVMDRLHALSYFLEGLQPVADRPECRAALDEGTALGSRLLEEIAPVFERSDVHAQLLRVRILGGLATAAEYAAVESFHDRSADPRLDGGYAFGRRAGVRLPFANPVSTAFCLQAAAWWEDCAAGQPRPDWRDLI